MGGKLPDMGLVPAPNPDWTSYDEMDDVYKWAAHSPYSPLHLQHLPQPMPRDAPPTLRDHFTFRDAFEDLLVAGSGAPLPDAREQARVKLLESYSRGGGPASSWIGGLGGVGVGGYSFGFGSGGGGPELHVTSWVNQLGTLGLWSSYFNLRLEVRDATTTGMSWRPSRFLADELMNPFHRGYFFRHEHAHGGHKSRPFWEELLGLGSGSGNGRGFWHDDEEQNEEEEEEESRRGRLLDPKKLWDDACKTIQNHVSPFVEKPRRGEGEDERNAGDAQVEEDLFTSNIPSSAVVVRPASSSVTTASPEQDDNTSSNVSTTNYPDGTKLVVTTKHRQLDSRSETTKTSQYYDQNGNLIAESRETSSSRSWRAGGSNGSGSGPSASASWTWKHSESSNHPQQGEEQKDNKKKNGWFWER